MSGGKEPSEKLEEIDSKALEGGLTMDGYRSSNTKTQDEKKEGLPFWKILVLGSTAIMAVYGFQSLTGLPDFGMATATILLFFFLRKISSP